MLGEDGGSDRTIRTATRSGPEADPIFAALSDPTRRRLLERLADGPATITGLHAGLPITRQAASKHLRILAQAGLVTDRREGRERYYALAPESLAVAGGWLAEIDARWTRRFAALRRLVEDE